MIIEVSRVINDRHITEVGVVVAIYEYPNQREFHIMQDPYDNDTYWTSNITAIIDDSVPRDWITKGHVAQNDKEYKIYSFEHWSKDPQFLNYLVEYSLWPKKTQSAIQDIRNEYDKIVSDYAVKKFGSVKAAKKSILMHKYNEQLKLAKERGFEKPDEPDFSDAVLNNVPLYVKEVVDAKPLKTKE